MEVGIALHLSPIHCEGIGGHCHWVWSPTGIVWQLVGQPAGKQIHLHRPQPLVDLLEDDWVQFPI